MASELKLNRKADVAITILVIGVFAICALAIIIFIISNQQTQNNFVSTDTLENLSSSLETFYFYVHMGFSDQDAANRVGAQLQDGQLILNAEQNQSSGLISSLISPKNQTALLSVHYIVDLSK